MIFDGAGGGTSRGGGGMKVSHRMVEVKKVQDFKYMGRMDQSDGEAKRRVLAGWNGWRTVSCVLCDKRVSVRMKGKCLK